MSLQYPTVNYDAHPAFESPFDRSHSDRSEAYVDVMERLYDLFDPIRTSDTPVSLRQAERRTQSKLDRCIEEARELLHVGQSARETAAIDAALVKGAGGLRAEAVYRSQAAAGVGASGERSAVAQALDVDGAFECQLDAAGKQRLCDALEPLKPEIDQHRPNAKLLTVLPTRGPEAELLVELLDNAGIPEGFSQFFNRPMRLHFWTLIRSDPSEVWWKDAYRDVGLATSPTTYFHIDYNFDRPKIMVYLTEVTDEHGPFEYLPGSHRWNRSVSLEVLNKEIERAHKYVWVDKGSPYYRPYMRLPEFREALMALPTPARNQSHFGDDVLAGTELHSFIDDHKRTVYSSEADCVAFDGNRMTHRGSLAESATRWALQIGFESVPSRMDALAHKGRSAAASLLRRNA